MPICGILEGYDTINWSIYFVCITGVISQTVLLTCLTIDPLKRFRNSATYLVANLAVSDLAVALQILFGTLGSKNEYVIVFSYAPVFASVFTILAISVDRYVMIAYPFKHRVLINSKKTAIGIVIIWLTSIVSPLLYAKAHSPQNLNNFKYSVYSIVILTTTTMYTLTCVSLKKQVRFLRGNEEKHARRLRVAKEKHFLNTCVIVAVLAVVTLTPATVYGKLNEDYDEATDGTDILHNILVALWSINFAINPGIYFTRLKNYRKAFFVVFCRKAIRKKSENIKIISASKDSNNKSM